MMDGSDELSCVGIVGDGCGGGREFIIREGTLFAYDPQTKENITLLQNIEMPMHISKKGCIISIKCEKRDIKFDLSSFKEV